MTYYCSKCGLAKTRMGGKRKRLECAPCKSSYSSKYRKENKARLKKHYTQSHIDNPLARKNKALKANYGITIDQYKEMLVTQNGVCAVCKQEETHKSKRYRYLAVDHCHKTGAIRGLLCSNCNRALGLLKDSTQVIQALHDYLTNAPGAQQPPMAS